MMFFVGLLLGIFVGFILTLLLIEQGILIVTEEYEREDDK